MAKGYESGICCPQEYHGTWKNQQLTVKISPINVTVITKTNQFRLHGKVLKEFYDYGYSVSYQVKKDIYYLSVSKGFLEGKLLLFKLTRNDKGQVRTIYNAKLQRD